MTQMKSILWQVGAGDPDPSLARSLAVKQQGDGRTFCKINSNKRKLRVPTLPMYSSRVKTGKNMKYQGYPMKTSGDIWSTN